MQTELTKGSIGILQYVCVGMTGGITQLREKYRNPWPLSLALALALVLREPEVAERVGEREEENAG